MNPNDNIGNEYDAMTGDQQERHEAANSHCSDSHGSLDALIEKWESCAKSWMKLADERSEDPDLADRAAARAAIYQDCANDLKEKT